MRRILLLLLCVGWIATGPAAAQSPDGENDAAADSTAQQEASGADWLILPYASYAPETKIAGGLVVGYYPAVEAGERPSSIQAVLTYTQRNQAIAELKPEWYVGSTWRVEGELVVSEYPDSFFGIGGETPDAIEQAYTSRYGLADLSLQALVREDLFVGGRLHTRYETDPEVEADCDAAGSLTLACNAVPGADGGVTAGVGVRATWDQRDNLNFPTAGTFADASLTWYSSVLGSDFTFARGKADLRGYRTAGPGVVAANVYLEGVAGTAPFQGLPLLGGADRMRGFREGRLRDDVYWTTQVAYRVPVFWRFGLVAFASAGEVGPRVGSDLVRDVELAAGLGGRMRLTDDGVHGRIDVAYSESGFQLYVSLGEAF